MSLISVLVVDDNSDLCESVARWLSREPGFAAVSCETDWRRAEEVIRARAPDIILLDIDMPGKSGLDLIEPLTRASPSSRVVMFSGSAARRSIEKALDNGAAGYLVKDQESSLLASLMRRAAAVEVVLCPIATEAMMGL